MVIKCNFTTKALVLNELVYFFYNVNVKTYLKVHAWVLTNNCQWPALASAKLNCDTPAGVELLLVVNFC